MKAAVTQKNLIICIKFQTQTALIPECSPKLSSKEIVMRHM